MFATEVSTAAQHDQGDEEDGVRHIVCPRVFAHKQLGVFVEGEDGHEGEGDQELHRQDHEHLRRDGRGRGWKTFRRQTQQDKTVCSLDMFHTIIVKATSYSTIILQPTLTVLAHN